MYDLISGNVNFVLYQYNEPDQFIHQYSYDADNRILEVKTSTDGFIWNSDARYIYYPHGPLARVELGEYNVQGMDYYYTLQGWLKGVNMPVNGDPGTDGQDGLRTGTDAMAFTLGYYEGDFKSIGQNSPLPDQRDQLWDRYREQSSSTGLYNGNIAWMETDLPGLARDNRVQAMLYGYDQLHRIVQARSLTEYSLESGFAARGNDPSPYDVDYGYDPNGNLLTLQRRDQAGAMQEDFQYSYYHGTNRLWHTAQDDGDNYQYDPIGNLTKDLKEGVDITWNPYGKVRRVDKTEGDATDFRYDAAGNRIVKIAGTDSTIYVRDPSGNVMAIYRNDTLVEQSIYGSNRLGLHLQAAKPGYRTLGHKRYELSNHLGNVLATVRDRIQLSSDSTWAEVGSISDYYPFGLSMAGRSLSDSTYRYGFNGKENDNSGEWGSKNHYDYGFRIYNPSLGKFLSVDPHAERYPSISPYAYVTNNPLIYIDPDGRDIIPVHGTWSNILTWGNLGGITKASNNLFKDNNLGVSFPWSGDNFSGARTDAAIGLIDHVRTQMKSEDFNGSITLVGHSHGGNVSIEALNMMAEMDEFNDVNLNLLTINTPVRDDYQLSEKASGRVNHVNVYDEKDPVQSNGGNSTSNKLFGVFSRGVRTGHRLGQQLGSGELGEAGRKFDNARQNISVDNPQGVGGDFHNSHNRTNDWIDKTKNK